MPRSNKTATKIAYKILGTPPAVAYKPTERQIYIDKTIQTQDNYRLK